MNDSLTSATSRFLAAIAPLTNAEMAAPSRLPDWSRGHVATHVARNADALVNLCIWAKTGIEHLMYPSKEERDSQIEEGARRSADEIVVDFQQSAARLRQAIGELDEAALRATVRTAPGGVGPATTAAKIPWMRLREVEIHLVDLGLAPTFADTPVDYLAELLAEEVPKFDGRLAGLTLNCSDGSRFQIGDGSQFINGSIGDVTAWLLGRANEEELARLISDRPIPQPPKWL